MGLKLLGLSTVIRFVVVGLDFLIDFKRASWIYFILLEFGCWQYNSKHVKKP